MRGGRAPLLGHHQVVNDNQIETTITTTTIHNMELKVWVEGIQRIVCGVTEKTTCQDVVYALAHATGKTGRFTLIERWRNNERLLAPQEHPLKVLNKWGEYSQDVQFILQRSALDGLKNTSPAPTKSDAKILG